MGLGVATVYGVLDAVPFALALSAALLVIGGDQFPSGQLAVITLLLGAGVGALLALISASRYTADGTRFWLLRSAVDAAILWWP